MSDNLLLNEGSGGANAATAEVSFSGDTAHVAIVGCSILSGSEGSWTLSQFVGGAGAVAAGVQRVTLASDDPAVTDLAAIEVLITAGNALLTTIDTDTGAMVTDLAAIEVLLTAMDADTSAMVVDLAAIEVLLTTIAGDTTSVDDKTPALGQALMAASVPVAIASNQSAITVDLGANNDVTVTSGTITAVTSITNAVAVTGTFWQATQPVSIAGTVTVDLGANNDVTLATLPDTAAGDLAAMVVDLAAIEVLLGTIDSDTGSILTAVGTTNFNTAASATALQVIDDWDESDRAKVNLIVGQAGIAGGAGAVGATVPRVTLASDDPAVVDLAAMEVLLGTIDTDAGNIATSTAVMDDWDSSDDCRSIVQSAAAMDGATRCDVKRFRVKCGTGANTLIGAVADKKFRIRSLAMLATSTTAVTVYLHTTTDTGVLGDATDKLTFDLDGGGGPAGVVLPHNPDGWLQTSTANEALTATLSAAEEVWIIGTYLEVA